MGQVFGMKNEESLQKYLGVFPKFFYICHYRFLLQRRYPWYAYEYKNNILKTIWPYSICFTTYQAILSEKPLPLTCRCNISNNLVLLVPQLLFSSMNFKLLLKSFYYQICLWQLIFHLQRGLMHSMIMHAYAMREGTTWLCDQKDLQM